MGHYIHILNIYLYLSWEEANHFKDVLQQLSLLFQCGGLQKLESLALHLHYQSMRKEEMNLGWAEAQAQSPNLKEVRLRGIGKEKKTWVSDS